MIKGHQYLVGERVGKSIKVEDTELFWFLSRVISSIGWLYFYTDLIYFD